MAGELVLKAQGTEQSPAELVKNAVSRATEMPSVSQRKARNLHSPNTPDDSEACDATRGNTSVRHGWEHAF